MNTSTTQPSDNNAPITAPQVENLATSLAVVYLQDAGKPVAAFINQAEKILKGTIWTVHRQSPNGLTQLDVTNYINGINDGSITKLPKRFADAVQIPAENLSHDYQSQKQVDYHSRELLDSQSKKIDDLTQLVTALLKEQRDDRDDLA